MLPPSWLIDRARRTDFHLPAHPRVPVPQRGFCPTCSSGSQHTGRRQLLLQTMLPWSDLSRRDVAGGQQKLNSGRRRNLVLAFGICVRAAQMKGGSNDRLPLPALLSNGPTLGSRRRFTCWCCSHGTRNPNRTGPYRLRNCKPGKSWPLQGTASAPDKRGRLAGMVALADLFPR